MLTLRDSVEYADGRTFTIGQRVRVINVAQDGGDVTGRILGFGKCRGAIAVLVEPDDYRALRLNVEWWPMRMGGQFVRIRDHGAFGGELEHIEE